MFKTYFYRLELGLCKFVNKFIRYQIVICNFLYIKYTSSQSPKLTYHLTHGPLKKLN